MPWTEQEGDVFLSYVVEREVLRERWESIKSASKEQRSVKEVARDMCLSRPMKQTPSEIVRAQEWVAPERLFFAA